MCGRARGADSTSNETSAIAGSARGHGDRGPAGIDSACVFRVGRVGPNSRFRLAPPEKPRHVPLGPPQGSLAATLDLHRGPLMVTPEPELLTGDKARAELRRTLGGAR